MNFSTQIHSSDGRVQMSHILTVSFSQNFVKRIISFELLHATGFTRHLKLIQAKKFLRIEILRKHIQRDSNITFKFFNNSLQRLLQNILGFPFTKLCTKKFIDNFPWTSLVLRSQNKSRCRSVPCQQPPPLNRSAVVSQVRFDSTRDTLLF